MDASKIFVLYIIFNFAFATMYSQANDGYERRALSGNRLVEVDGLDYELVDGKAEVYRFVNQNDCSRIDIPSSIVYGDECFDVTKIAYSAFAGCYFLDSITVPESVTQIANGAFSGCQRLSYIRIKNPATILHNIHPRIDCPNLPCENGIRYADKIAVDWDKIAGQPYVIKEGTVSIASNAFSRLDCESIQIPVSVKIIGQYAFDMSTLSSITLPDSLEIIGEGAFAGCANLKSIRIPKNVCDISGRILSDCPALTQIEVSPDNPRYDSRDNCNAIIESATNRLVEGCTGTVIPQNVVEIADYAFSECSGLKTLSLPASVAKIGRFAIVDSNIESIKINRNNPFLESRRDAVIDKKTGELIFAIANASRIPGGVKSIGWGAYWNIKGLENVRIPRSVDSIGTNAFGDCQKLKTVCMLGNITEIPNVLFSGCANLQSVKFPKGLQSIPNRFFRDCPNLQKVAIYESVQNIGEYAFAGTSVRKIKLPKSLHTISQGLFYECERLGSVIMPESLDSICARSFARCKSLRSITIPEGTLSIGNQAFWGTGLESVTIPESVTQIGDLAFSYCDKLKSVEILGQIEHMGAHVFNHDGGLRTIKLSSSQPPYVEQGDALYDYKPLFENCTLYVPSQCIGQYRESPFWGQFKNIEPLTK